MKKWITFFSQTGSEIYNVSEKLGIDPDLIVVNKSDLSEVNQKLLEKYKDRFYILPNKPKGEDYLDLIEEESKIFNDCIITLHGYLRIIPSFMCDEFEIYNLHPGLITKYPELKGFNPQEKAYNLKLPTSGVVIHKATSVLDSGEILKSKEISIKNKTLDQIYEDLHNVASELWSEFLSEKFVDLNIEKNI